ncbi:TRAP transporter large permease subunit [Rhizobium laguerreae]|uniref:TRAP transporter large permease n=1 Tax=Rhizobium laguerreae TaxID=1076926 RepID=UPI001C929AD8|nr:TRAP transporter large permease subunit [Rhizobium laguerreae]MBY3307579.1 TRAP transporter large permease subunit [Rhizobium laguerreae]
MTVNAAPALETGMHGGESLIPAPRWLGLLDTVAIAILNISLIAQVLLIFSSTILRSYTNSPLIVGAAETAHAFLVTISFLGGAVSYSRGNFVAITFLSDRMPLRLRPFLAALVEWTVILVTALVGYYSIPLVISNVEETTIVLGISYVWMTVPITLGCALFVLHAAVRLSRLPVPAIVAAAFIPALAVALFLMSQDALGQNVHALYVTLAGMFLLQLILGIPIGFILATTGIVCVLSSQSADMVAVVMNAQRGSDGFILLALPFFIFAGFIMDRADIGSRIVNLIVALIGHVRGGLLQVMVVGCYLGSCISGSKAADMAMIGIPMSKQLEEEGYPAPERAAVLAAAAAMSESVPPSIALILIGSATGISTGALFIAGVLPAATLAIFQMLLIRVRASMFGWKPRPRAPLSRVISTGRSAFFPLLLPVILIGGIVGGLGTPTEVSTFAVLYGLLLGLLYRKFTLASFWQTMTNASMLNGMVFFTVSMATVFSWALTLEGVTASLADFVSHFGPTGFLLSVIVIFVLVGAVLESFVTIIILAPLLMPVAMSLHVDPLHYGIVMAEAFGIGVVLPPIGIALYVACKITGARVEPTSRILLWYLSVLVIGLFVLVAFPSITTILPSLLNVKG